jgi:cytoskeletal protein CcmA (bactofilin family)
MSEQKRRFLERALHASLGTSLQESATATFVAAESVFVGNIRGPGLFIVAGSIDGDGELDGGLILSVTGHWRGNIHAHQAVVAGKIVGNLTVKDTLEIGYSAVIRGKVSARTIAIAKGAIVDGEVEVTSETPILRFEEKRAAPE